MLATKCSLSLPGVLFVALAFGITGKASAWEAHITKDAAPGCLENDDLDKAYRLSGDHEAFVKFMLAAILEGRCTLFDAGEEVDQSDGKWTVVKVRRKGDTNEYWVPREAITSNP